MMKGAVERIQGKKIVIWGPGPLQRDLEGFFPFLKPVLYLDGQLQRLEEILRGDIMDPRNLLIILCRDENRAIACLKKMGYGSESYLLGQELLADSLLYQRICEKELWIWGIGDTYYRREKDIHEYLPIIGNFIVTEKTENEFQGRKVLSKEEVKNRKENTYIVVTSVYYEEIYRDLIQLGLKPGNDFAHVDTLILLGKMTRMAETGFQLDDRRKHSKELAVILAGYKEFVWDSVFPRLKAYIPSDMDVCVVSSGLVSPRLRAMCRAYGWSYMSTERNNVSLALNMAIWKHPKAEYIYKLDEDIFVTAGVFETVKDVYEDAKRRGRYSVGFATPLIPVNGYGYARLLEILGRVEAWEHRFGILKYGTGPIYWKPEAARFMWELGKLDDIGELLKEKEFCYSACPVIYSIGFILFHRNVWSDMGMFPMLWHKNIGADEEYLCGYCMRNGMSAVVAENAVAGHLSYGPQNGEMETYYHEHKEAFCLRE